MDGFESVSVDLGDCRVHAFRAGEGPPLLLMHGYPQTALMWHRIAPALAAGHSVVVPDMPGHGRSSVPPGGPPRYAKRRLAADMVALMAALGHERFIAAGHDRGGRVAYRMALDSPERVAALAVLDIVPTGEVWDAFDAARALAYYHWAFLAQPAPLPETLIGLDPAFYLDTTLKSWSKSRTLDAFAPAALADYHASFADHAHIAAACDDYRAGAGIDRDDDKASRADGAVIACPTLALWGASFGASGARSQLDVWRTWAPGVQGTAIDSGHFLAEEAPEAVLADLAPFLANAAGG